MSYLFTSESVSEGHPDKLCDAISDAILDACLSTDPFARVAVETLVKGTKEESVIVLAGEVTLEGPEPQYVQIARQTAAEIGYSDHDIGMDANSEGLCKVEVHISTQSTHIAMGISRGEPQSQGAGDQGIMFGFACDETESFEELRGSFMPLPLALAQRLTSKMSESMKNGEISWSRPDSKSQVTIEYDDQGVPMRVDTVVVAIQHDDLANEMFDGNETAEADFIQSEISQKIIRQVIPGGLIDEVTKIIVNGTGRFVHGGPYADAGVTGRKIIVDTYGGMGRHGGGAFSGKDPSKVDRTAAYAARWAAKHVVASGLSSRCEIQLSYAIGVAEPVSINVNTFGFGEIPDSELSELVHELFDFRPGAILEYLGLRSPIYNRTAAGGHFGRSPDQSGGFSWESLDQEKLDFLSRT